MASRILREFVIDKIAVVDRPCQEHAMVAIMKRAPTDDEIAKSSRTAVGVLLDDLAKKVRVASVEAAQRTMVKLKMDVLSTQAKSKK